MSFSVSDGAGRFEWASRPPGLFANPAQALDPRFHRMLADLVRFHREARAPRRAQRRRPLAARFPRRAPLLGVLHRAADRAAGVVDLVRGSCRAVVVPGQLSRGLLRQPRSSPARRQASLAQRVGRLAPLCGGARRCLRRPRFTFGHRCVESSAIRSVSTSRFDDTVARFDEVVLAVHSDQALALLADAEPGRAGSARSDPVPDERDCSPHRRAAAATPPRGEGELELPPDRDAGRQDHDHV